MRYCQPCIQFCFMFRVFTTQAKFSLMKTGSELLPVVALQRDDNRAYVCIRRSKAKGMNDSNNKWTNYYLTATFWQMVCYQHLYCHLRAQRATSYQPRSQSSSGYISEWRRPYWKPWYSAFAKEETEENCIHRWRTDHPRRRLWEYSFRSFKYGEKEAGLFIFGNGWTRYCWRHSREVCGETSWITAI